jgi:hypothetical protein
MASDFETRINHLCDTMNKLCENETYAAAITAHLLVAMVMLTDAEETGAPWPMEVQLMLALMAKFCATMRETAKAEEGTSTQVH